MDKGLKREEKIEAIKKTITLDRLRLVLENVPIDFKKKDIATWTKAAILLKELDKNQFDKIYSASIYVVFIERNVTLTGLRQILTDLKIKFMSSYLSTWEKARGVLINLGSEDLQEIKQTLLRQHIALIKDLLKENHKDLMLWFELATKYVDLKEPNEAIKCYKEAVSISPNFTDAWFNLGWTYDDIGEFQNAVECYQKVVKLTPKDASAWNNLGWGYLSLAIQSYQTGAERDPKDEEIKGDLTALKKVKEASLARESKKQIIKVFISYSQQDLERFKIQEFAEGLKEMDRRLEVEYWEKWVGGNVDQIDYMNKNIPDCNVFIPFCSAKYNDSKNCEKEWKVANIDNKPTIPLFEDLNDVPKIIRIWKGVNITNKNISEIIKIVYEKILNVIKNP